MALRIAILVCRAVAVLSGIILLGVVASNGSVTDPFTSKSNVCIFNRVASICAFAEAVGAMGLVLGGILLIFDILLLTDTMTDKTSLLDKISFGVSALMCLLSVICFGLMVTEWNANSVHERYIFIDLNGSTTPAQSAMAFSMIGLLVWIALLVLSALDLRSSDTMSM